MFNSLHNRAKLSFKLIPDGPILIKAGGTSADPTRPDMEFVRTRHALFGETVYIPGSSFKGIVRSYAEKILRTLGFTNTCNPLDQRSACRELDRDKLSGAQIYSKSCYACRTFGSTSLAARTAFIDLYPWDNDGSENLKEVTNRTEFRMGVGIDRRKGSAAKGALFELEIVTGGAFFGEIIFRNFQLWQLALISFALRDMDEGYQYLGYGKSRGLGKVKCELKRLEIEEIDGSDRTSRNSKICGLGKLMPQKEVEDLDLLPDDEIVKPDYCEEKSIPLGRRFCIQRDNVWTFLNLSSEEPWQGLLNNKGKKNGT